MVSVLGALRAIGGLVAVAVVLVGCASLFDVGDNRACIVKTIIPTDAANCAGTYDITYYYKNPPRPTGNPNIYILYNDQIFNNRTIQETADSCYSAALVSGFQYYGIHYSQSQFRAAISNQCFASGSIPLTFSQIVFAATRVHLDSGVWYIDVPGNPFSSLVNNMASGSQQAGQTRITAYEEIHHCQSPDGASATAWINYNLDPARVASSWLQGSPLSAQAALSGTPGLPPADLSALTSIDLYHPILWHFKDLPDNSVSGGIIPIRDSQHMLQLFSSNMPIFAGISTGSLGHVVTVWRMAFPVVESEGIRVPDPSGHIEWVDVVDPENQENPTHIIPGDEFFREARFIFALAQERHP